MPDDTSRSYDALSERVNNQGSQIRDLAADTSKRFTELSESTSRQFSEFRQSVANDFSAIAGTLKGLESKLDTTNSTQAERGRVNWLALIGAAVGIFGVTATFLGHETSVALTPINDKVAAEAQSTANLSTRLDNSVANLVSKIETTTSGFVSRGELDDRRQRLDATVKAVKDDVTTLRDSTPNKDAIKGEFDMASARIKRAEDDITSLRAAGEKTADKTVSRGEHEQRWAAEAQQRADLQRQIDDIKRNQADLYPASALLRSLSERQHELEVKVYKERQ